MRIGEVNLNPNDVVRLADFYKQLLDIDNGSNDAAAAGNGGLRSYRSRPGVPGAR